jgi:hypothetical protein
MSKGDKRRPSSISRAEEELRWKLANGKISFATFEKRYKKMLQEGKITRDGRVVKP